MATQPILQPIVDYAIGGVSPSWPIPYKSDVAPDYSDLTSMFVERDGSGGNPGSSETIGLVLNKAGMGGQTAEAYIASRPDLADVDTQTTINASSATRNGAGWDLTASGTFPVIQQAFTIDAGDWFRVTATWSGNTNGRGLNVNCGGLIIQLGTADSGTETVIGRATGDDWIRLGSGNAVSGDTFYFELTSIKRIPGEHLTAPADNQRPVLDVTNGVYSPDYDGVDDGLTYSFPGGAGPADCSVFYAENTGSGRSVVEEVNQDYSAASSVSISDIVGGTPNGQYIAPIIVEASKLTNSLRRTIEQDLKRKAGIQ